jgi:Lar family restriction alleviation protein
MEEAMKPDLLPCPFCQSDDVMVSDVAPSGQMSEYSHVICCDCNATGPIKPFDNAAIAAWNTRAPDLAAEKRGEERERERCAQVAMRFVRYTDSVRGTTVNPHADATQIARAIRNPPAQEIRKGTL